MVGGFANIATGVLVVYTDFWRTICPKCGGHLAAGVLHLRAGDACCRQAHHARNQHAANRRRREIQGRAASTPTSSTPPRAAPAKAWLWPSMSAPCSSLSPRWSPCSTPFPPHRLDAPRRQHDRSSIRLDAEHVLGGSAPLAWLSGDRAGSIARGRLAAGRQDGAQRVHRLLSDEPVIPEGPALSLAARRR